MKRALAGSSERQPVALGHLAGLLGARQGRRDANAQVVRVRAVHLERERGLRVAEPGGAGERNRREVVRIAAVHGAAQRPVGVGIDVAKRIVRKCLRVAADEVPVALLVAVGAMGRLRLAPLELRRIDPQLIRVAGAFVERMVVVVAAAVPASGRACLAAKGERRARGHATPPICAKNARRSAGKQNFECIHTSPSDVVLLRSKSAGGCTDWNRSGPERFTRVRPAESMPKTPLLHEMC